MPWKYLGYNEPPATKTATDDFQRAISKLETIRHQIPSRNVEFDAAAIQIANQRLYQFYIANAKKLPGGAVQSLYQTLQWLGKSLKQAQYLESDPRVRSEIIGFLSRASAGINVEISEIKESL